MTVLTWQESDDDSQPTSGHFELAASKFDFLDVNFGPVDSDEEEMGEDGRSGEKVEFSSYFDDEDGEGLSGGYDV